MRKTTPAGNWYKSSYSGANGNCVEIARVPTPFRKSSYSAGAHNCVEVAEGLVTKVRDTQHRDHGTLTFDSAEWRAFLDTTKPATPSQW